MKFKTTSKEIKNFVLSVSRAIDIKPSNPALQGIYLRAENGLCELIGTDLDLVIKAKFPVEVLVDGESLINSRVFSEVVRKLPVGEERCGHRDFLRQGFLALPAALLPPLEVEAEGSHREEVRRHRGSALFVRSLLYVGNP